MINRPGSIPFAHRLRWLFPLLLIASALLYWPGLRGDYIQDDYPNIVDNPYIRVHGFDVNAWTQAAWASPSSDLRRPLATLSFTANYAADGLAPWPMKAVNLAIHLFNGWLLFVLLRRLAIAAAPAADDKRAHTIAALVAGIWLLHPINLTAVLYVVQRMESLAQVFVLAGLIAYVDARVRQRAGSTGAAWRLWLAVPACTVLGLLAKESAALLPAYALLIEITVFAEPHRAPRERRELGAFFTIFLFAPVVLGLAWLIPRFMTPEAYAARPFTLAERLLTEPRVLVDYIAAILAPLPSSFSLYHDDFPISTGLAHPWTTLGAIALLAAMAALGIFLRRRRPLIALGLLGFLVAHSMTATFIPLELVYEHRNYLASALLLLALVDALLPRGKIDVRLGSARVAAVAALMVLCGFSLALRAREWSDPLHLALTEAARHPESPRATYELGRTYTVMSDRTNDQSLLDRAVATLEQAGGVPNAGILPEVALLGLAGRHELAVDRRWWTQIRDKLAAHAPSVEDLSALVTLARCQRAGHCPQNDPAMLRVMLAAVGHDPPHAAALYSYALFAYARLHDTELALRLSRAAADAPPHDPQYRLNLINFLIDIGRYDEAGKEMATLRAKVHDGQLSIGMTKAENRLREVEAAQRPQGKSG